MTRTSENLVKELRIAYFAEVFPSPSETWIHHEIAELLAKGHAVRVFATHPRPKTVPAELQKLLAITTYLPEEWNTSTSALRGMLKWSFVRPVIKGFFGDVRGLRQRAQVMRDLFYTARSSMAVRAFRPSLLYAHFAGTRTNLALFHSLSSGIPFAFKMHAFDVFNRVALLRLKTERAARILTISDYNISYMKSHYPDVDATRIEKHACGIPLDRYGRRVPPVDVNLPLIAAVGRLVPMKGFDALVQASRILLDRGVRHEVRILGDGPEMRTLTAMVHRLGLGEAVVLAGYATPDTVRELLAKATAFVLPATWDPVNHTQDGIPVALMEAMAIGVPVVSTSTSGIPELIEDGVGGILVPADDPEALAAGIAQVIAMDAEVRGRMLRAAHRKIEASHDAQALAESFIQIATRI